MPFVSTTMLGTFGRNFQKTCDKKFLCTGQVNLVIFKVSKFFRLDGLVLRKTTFFDLFFFSLALSKETFARSTLKMHFFLGAQGKKLVFLSPKKKVFLLFKEFP
jgi:hypothetical protein